MILVFIITLLLFMLIILSIVLIYVALAFKKDGKTKESHILILDDRTGDVDFKNIEYK